MFSLARYAWGCTVAVLLSLSLAGVACPGDQGPEACPPERTGQTPNVAGVFRYSGDRALMLTGTITFEQEGALVRVTDTTYDFTGDRRLQGEAVLQGNRLAIQLVPKNGDTDYRADVIFLFSDDGSEFCVEFADTNGDSGDMGTYRGVRIRP